MKFDRSVVGECFATEKIVHSYNALRVHSNSVAFYFLMTTLKILNLKQKKRKLKKNLVFPHKIHARAREKKTE